VTWTTNKTIFLEYQTLGLHHDVADATEISHNTAIAAIPTIQPYAH